MVKILILLFLAFLYTVSAKPYKTKILERIEHFNSQENTWKAGYTEFSALSNEEKKKLLGALFPQDKRIQTKLIAVPANIPVSFDARSQWPECNTISSIKDQGDCGSCWAVSTASAASDRLCIATGFKKNLNLSIENLMSCCSDCAPNGGCNGGYPDEAWTYLSKTGLVTGGDYHSNEGCQPYQISPTGGSTERVVGTSTPTCASDCTNSKYSIKYSSDLNYGTESYTISNNVSQIQSDIQQHGPIVACFEVFEDFYDYKSGVYSHSYGNSMGHHAVRVIGWGTDKGVDYWLVANSWNKDFGEQGLFKIKRGINECGIEDEVIGGHMKP